MSFDIHLAPLAVVGQPFDAAAVNRILEAHLVEAQPGRLHTADGAADLYGEVEPSSWLMVNHVDGIEAWSVIHEIAASGPCAVLPADCPTFVTRLDHGGAVPDEFPRPVVVVADGQELRRAIVAGADGALPPRRSADALEMIRSFLGRCGTSLEALTASTAVLAMTSWYLLQRVEDVDLESDGDMLLCQWGTYHWGEAPTFEYNVTRQLVVESPDEPDPLIWQLSLTLHFQPSDGEGLGRGHRWCRQPDGLAEFQEYAMAAEPTGRLDRVPPLRVTLDLETVD